MGLLVAQLLTISNITNPQAPQEEDCVYLAFPSGFGALQLPRNYTNRHFCIDKGFIELALHDAVRRFVNLEKPCDERT